MPGPKKGQRFAGRAKGTKNKATVEREINAAQVIDRARKEGRDLAVTVLERLMKVAESTAGLSKPTVAREKAAGAVDNPDGDWGRFGEWFDRTAYCAKELAKFQSPQIRAVAVAFTSPIADAGPPQITRDGNVVTINDANAAARVYANTVKRTA